MTITNLSSPDLGTNLGPTNRLRPPAQWRDISLLHSAETSVKLNLTEFVSSIWIWGTSSWNKTKRGAPEVKPCWKFDEIDFSNAFFSEDLDVFFEYRTSYWIRLTENKWGCLFGPLLVVTSFGAYDPEIVPECLDSDARRKLPHRISCSNQQSLHLHPCDINTFECCWALMVFAQIRAAAARLEEMIRYQRLFWWSSPTNPGAAIRKELKHHFAMSRYHVKKQQDMVPAIQHLFPKTWLQHMLLLNMHFLHHAT